MRMWINQTAMTMIQCLKVLFADKKTIVILLAGLLFSGGLLYDMETVKEEKSKIPIGIADAGNSEISRKVAESMKQKDLYEVVLGSEEELLEQWRAGELSAVCVLKKTLSEDIARGKTKNLVKIYETEDSPAWLLGDIVAGTMMQEICMAKGYQMLLKYQSRTGRDETLSADEYQNYVRDIQNTTGLDFSFDITYLSAAGENAEKPSQSIVYEQAVFAIFALMAGLLSAYAVLPFWQLCHGRLSERIKAMPVYGSALSMGCALSGLLLPLFFGFLFLGGLFLKNPMEISKFLSLLVCTIVYLCVIVCIVLCAAYGIRSYTAYQMGMLAMLLVFGAFGLISLVDGLLVPEGTVGFVPNGWYVKKNDRTLPPINKRRKNNE